MTHPPVALPSDQDASGRSFGEAELRLLQEVMSSGTLNCTRGTKVRELEERFAALCGVPFCRCVTSGTAAIHAAVAAIDPEPGDEIITTPITDMGAIAPILYQTAIPVFADVDPRTYNVTAETIAPLITRRTKAVIVTHLFGNPCDMDPILALCERHGLPVIEDAAQAFLADYKGRKVGGIGTIGCFSMQQGKHMTSGEGGMVVCRDPELARRVRLFVDKAWGYGDPNPDHYFLALNYRMTELQGAVALAQVARLGPAIETRVRMADRLTRELHGLRGVEPPRVNDGSRHVYWRYALRVDPQEVPGGTDRLGAKLQSMGVACAPRYTKKLAFECQVIRERRTFGNSGFPFVGPHRDGEPEIRYERARTPGAVEALERVIVLPLNERYQEAHIDHVASVLRQAVEELTDA